MSGVWRVLTIGAAVGTGAMGGVFFAFSSFVMAGLGRLPPARGAAAMQAINVTAVRPVFMTGLFGTAVACVALLVRGVRTWGDPWATLVLIGGGLYLIGTIGLTLAYHVPLNNGLAALDPDRAGAAAEWERYAKNWTRANHVRAAAALAAAAAYGIALTEPTTAGAG